MNKKFDVIPIEDYGVVVDKQIQPDANDYFIAEGYLSELRKLTAWEKEHQTQIMCWKVIATINKRIDDIPLIELPDEHLRAILSRPKLYPPGDFLNGYLAGYKAAQKNYSEEDLLRYMEFRMIHWKESIKKQEFKDSPKPFEESDKAVHERAVKSLQPKLPKSVILSLCCPKCKEKENFHFNYDYSEKDMPVNEILCNECGEFFKEGKVLITNPSTNTIIPISMSKL